MKQSTKENAAKTPTMTTRLRVQLDFSEDAFKRLEELGKETGVNSKAEIIRDALRIYEWIVEQSRDKRIIEVQEQDGTQVSKIEAKWFL
jgi:metal-responsive CopG/Arc/MetJ family transcriptional regulator